jgi:prepilin-type processing-associated H-X9-DG protein
LAAPQLPNPVPFGDSNHAVIDKHLVQDGDFYFRMDTRTWEANLTGVVEKLWSMVADLAPPEEREDLRLTRHFVDAFLRDSGVLAFGGVGASSVTGAGGIHQNRVFIQHPTGEPEGFLWATFTAENQTFELLPRLPATTAYARWIALDPGPAWNWLRTTIEGCGREDIVRDFHEGLERARKDEGVDIDRWLASFGGGIGMIATLDPATMINLPLDHGKTIPFPSFGFAVIASVKDDTLFEAVATALEKDGKKAKRVEASGIRSLVMPKQEVGKTGFFMAPTFSRFGQYLVFATSPELASSLAEPSRGLLGTEQFQRLQVGMPQEGYGFSYLSPTATQTVYDAILAAVAADEADLLPIVSAAYGSFRGVFSYSVSQRTADGVLVVANQNGGIGQFLSFHSQTVNVPILAGMLLPALSQAREKARRINDLGNLKQIGLGLRIYSADHGETFPADLGVLMEEDYLRTGKVYICPASKTVPPATAADVRAGRCDYLYFGKGRTERDCGTKDPIACTKPGLFSRGYINVLYGDGHVRGYRTMPEDVRKLIDAQK